MTKHLPTRVLATLALVVVAVVTHASTVHAAQLPAGTRSWPTRTVYVHDTIGDPITRLAVAEWDALGVVHLVELDHPCGHTPACIEVTHTALPPQLGGWTYLVDDHHGTITGTQVLIESERPLPESWALNVTVHELGHALGLEHTAGADSVMTPMVSGRQGPTAYDAWMLAEAYASR